MNIIRLHLHYTGTAPALHLHCTCINYNHWIEFKQMSQFNSMHTNQILSKNWIQVTDNAIELIHCPEFHECFELIEFIEFTKVNCSMSRWQFHALITINELNSIKWTNSMNTSQFISRNWIQFTDITLKWFNVLNFMNAWNWMNSLNLQTWIASRHNALITF